MDFQLDTKPLDSAIDLAKTWSGSTAQFLVLRTAQRIVSKARRYTPFVAVGTIDAELDVAYAPGKTPTGKLSKQAKNARFLPGMATTKGSKWTQWREETFGEKMPLAYMIQLARMKPGSNYNQLTNNRWRLPGFQMLKGLDAISRITVLQGLAERMIKARHSSTHFLMSGWVSAAKKLYNLRGAYKSAGGPPLDSDLDAGFSGKAVSAKPNMSAVKFAASSDTAEITVGNLIGMVDARVNGSNAANYNRALMQHGGPALQRAINEVSGEMTEHYLEKEMKAMAAAFGAIR